MRNEELGMRNVMKRIINFGVLALALFIFAGCPNPFEQPRQKSGGTQTALVSIYIGEPVTGARTVQPGGDSLAGYQLTFSGGTHDPVNITGVNRADVYLANGTWTVTAKAYKSGGEIGNNDDAVASGSISITVANGAVSGAVPPIILESIGTGTGTLHYAITLESGVTGKLTLWQINGLDKITGFGTNGELSLSTSSENDFSISAGRYIIEAKLTNGAGNIAFRREVVEVWVDTATAFVFAPTEYLDPNMVLANSKANLSETETKINNNAIGTGTGNGSSEQNPKTYTFTTTNAGNISITLVFENDSLFATYNWALNTGSAPGGTYSTAALPTDFSTNNVLWVKAVSEDGSTTVYYQFAIMLPPPPPPSNGSFTDTDYNSGRIGGTISWTKPDTLDRIAGYRIYWGSDETTKLSQTPVYTVNDPSANSQTVDANTQLPSGAMFFLIYSFNGSIDYPDCHAISIIDLAGSVYGNLTILYAGSGKISYSYPYIDITQNGTYYIIGNGTTSTYRICVYGSNITADIMLKNINIDVSATTDALAFDAGENNTVNLTLEGTNTLRSGRNKAGLRVPSNTTLVISGGGSLNMTGGVNGAGIGGNNNESAGSITINDGTVTANGGEYAASIGGGIYGAGGTITINGGTVTATSYSVRGSAGIGGGYYAAGGTITINGGTVTATGTVGAGIGTGYYNGGNNDNIVTITGGIVTATSTSGAGIGAGAGNSMSSGTLNISNNAVVFASSIHSFAGGSDMNDSIVFNDYNTGTLYGNVTLAQDVTFDAGWVLTINAEKSLTIPNAITLTNNGTINNDGTITVEAGGAIAGSGTVTGNQPVYQ
jgi:hypothetical protein